MSKMVLADPRNVVELATLARNPLLIEKYGKEHMAEFVRNQSGTEMLNALNGVISLWGQSSSASSQDFWAHGPLTMTKEEGRHTWLLEGGISHSHSLSHGK